MKLLKRIFGICETQPPLVENSWNYTDHQIRINLKQMSELAEPGGAVRLEGNRLPERILLVHGRDGRFHAFANKCTHQGRRLDPLPGKEAVQCCSLLKSTFSYAGDPISGASQTPVQIFPVTTEGDELMINLLTTTAESDR